MHDRDPFRAPTREPKPGTFHRPAHGFGIDLASEAAEMRLSGPKTGEQKLGEGLADLPLLGTPGPRRSRDQVGSPPLGERTSGRAQTSHRADD
jgi:hypothetical protein